MRTRCPGRGSGFTLIELIAVMVIIGVLAATAAPSLSNLAATRANAAARQLNRDLSYARQRAVATGNVTWVVFDAANESWTMLIEDPNNPGRANAVALTDLASGQPFAQTLNDGAFVGVEIDTVSFDGGDEVGFDWLGRPLNDAETQLAAVGSVALTDGHAINIAPETGYATHVAP